MANTENITKLKNALAEMDENTVTEIQWVVGEAMHFAYMCGAIDKHDNKDTFYSELKQRVLKYLHDDAEREMLSILSD